MRMARGMIRAPRCRRPRAAQATAAGAGAGAGAERGAGGERGAKATATATTRKQSSPSQPRPQPPQPPPDRRGSRSPPLPPPPPLPPSRRDLLATTGLLATAAAAAVSGSSALAPAAAAAAAAETAAAAKTAAAAAAAAAAAPPSTAGLAASFPASYSLPGPYAVARLPLLEHVCPRLSPACVGKQCAVTLEFLVPRLLPESGDGGGGEAEGEGEGGGEEEGGARRGRRGGSASKTKAAHVAPPRRAPLAILSGGFLVGRAAYASTARHLCSWGFAVCSYDKAETALDPLDDVVSAAVVLEVADFVASSAGLSGLIDAGRLYLVGHSRGGKLSVLAAARDDGGGVESGGGGGGGSGSGEGGGGSGSGVPPPSSSPSPPSSPSSPPPRAKPPRVRALGLVDPVNNTVYAPQGPRFPSATAALRGVPALAATPLLAVASGPLVSGRDCAPADAAAPSFFEACRSGPAWLVTLQPAGHFQFLDEQTAVQRAVCASGPVEDEAVRASARAALAAWGRLAVFGDGGGVGGGGVGGGGRRSGEEEEEEEEERRRSDGAGESASPSLPSPSPRSSPEELLERTERDIEGLLRDGMTKGGGGGEYTKKLRAPPFLSCRRKHISSFGEST